MYYHASQTANIKYLEPRVSNENTPLVYFSTKRENVLVYLSNAVEKYCRETNFEHSDKWEKWGSYGFSADGILRLEEYYPNATEDTYKGVSAYIYSTELLTDAKVMQNIPFAVTADHKVEIQHCEFIPDAYDTIMEAVNKGLITLQRYEDMSEHKHNWIKENIKKEYNNAQSGDDYRYFLKGKFPFLQDK